MLLFLEIFMTNHQRVLLKILFKNNDSVALKIDQTVYNWKYLSQIYSFKLSFTY